MVRRAAGKNHFFKITFLMTLVCWLDEGRQPDVTGMIKNFLRRLTTSQCSAPIDAIGSYLCRHNL